MLRERDYSTYGYFRYLAFDSHFLGKYAQTFGFSVGSTTWEPGHLSYANGQWSQFYGAFSDFVKLVDLYENMVEVDKQNNRLFLTAAKVHLYDWLLACVDLYGDMPFSDACTLPFTSDVVASYATYDKAEDIYSAVLDELKECGDYLVSPSLVKIARFNTQDFINWGDVDKWARYANSLRLRAALRVADHGSLVEKGRSAIREILENPSAYPLVEDNEQNVFIANQNSGELNLDHPGNGFHEWASGRVASGPIIKRMLSNGNYMKDKPASGTYVDGTDDPRLPLLYTMRKLNPTTHSALNGGQDHTIVHSRAVVGIDSLRFVGTDAEVLAQDPGYYDGITSEIIENGFFWRNRNMDNHLMTASEVLFSKAEAYHRGLGVARDEAKAEAAFKEGVAQSIKFYFKYNENSSGAVTRAFPTPTEEAIQAYAAARWVSSVNPGVPYSAADPKLDAILTQKWLHWGFLAGRQALSEIRRTGLPKLVYPRAGAGDLQWPPERWKYSIEEQHYNPNYPGLDADRYDIKLFWVNPNGMRHSTYENGVWSDQWGD
jgi:hypothetical protein